MNLTRRKFLTGGAAVVAVAAVGVQVIPYASGGIIPKRTYTYVRFHNLPLCEFGNRIPWVSAQIIGAPHMREIVGFKNISSRIDEYTHEHNQGGKPTFEYTYKGSAVTAIEGEAKVEKVWLDGVESKIYTVSYGD